MKVLINHIFIFLLILLPTTLLAQFEFTEHLLAENVVTGAAVAIDDLDQDGLNDLLTTCTHPDPETMLMWYHNLGNNNFELITTPGTLAWYNESAGIELVDLDNDGDLDIFTIVLDDMLTNAWLLENDGDNNFTSRMLFFASSAWPDNYSLIDYEDDGDLDVIYTSGSRVRWEINNGQAEFPEDDQIMIDVDGPSFGRSEYLDYDYDGDYDIITYSNANEFRGFKFVENLGNDNWQMHELFGIEEQAYWNVFSVDDIDGDNDYDITTAYYIDNFIGGVKYFRNNGNNSFQEINLTTEFYQCGNIQTADFDLDGDLDILATSTYEDEVRIWEYIGGTSFIEHLVDDFLDGAYTADIGDIEGDGDLDIMVFSYEANHIKYYTNNWDPNALDLTSSVGISAALVSNEDISDAGTVAALHPEATDGYDEFNDILKDPHPQNDYISIYFPHPEWGLEFGENFAVDVRNGTQNLNNEVKVYEFQVKTDFIGSDIVLQLDISDDYPDEFGVVLVDLENNIVQDLEQNSEYIFNAGSMISNFELRIGDATAPDINIIYPYTNQGLYINRDYTLSWSINDINPIQYTTLDFSEDGLSWTRLDSVSGALESYLWTSPGTLTQDAQIRVGACDWTGRSNSQTRQFRLVSSLGNTAGGVYITASTELNSGQQVVDEGNLAALSPAATDGFDADFDIPKPPPMFNNYLQVFFPHPEWETIFGDRFMVDVRDGTEDLVNGVKTYLMNVTTDIENADVNLQFDINEDYPPELGVVVRELNTGEYYNLRENSTLDYVAEDTLSQFELYLGDALDPDITVTFPEQNEWLDEGHNYTLTWEIEDVSAIKYTVIEYALNEGDDWIQIDSLAGEVESIEWTTPEQDSENARLRIRAADVAGHIANTVQPFRLTILNPPEITFLTFTEEIVYELNQVEEVLWEYSWPEIVNHSILSISDDDGQSWSILDTLFEDSALNTITLPDYFTAYARLKVDAWINTGEYGTAVCPRFAVAPFEMEKPFLESWSLVSVPLLNEYTLIDSIFGDDILTSYYVFRISQNQSYIPVTDVNLGTGYWLALENEAVIDVNGEPQIGENYLDLHPSWNLVGATVPGEMTIDSLYFGLEENFFDYNQAAAAGWIVPALYTYQGSSVGYTLSETLEPWHGYALFVHADGLVMNTHPPYPSPPEEVTDELMVEAENTIETDEIDDHNNWLVNIRVNRTDNTMSDQLAALGVAEDASEDYDAQYDLPRPPNPPDMNWLRTVYLREDWPAIGDSRYIRDIRRPLEVGESFSWDLRVESTENGATHIEFTGIDELPDDLEIICYRPTDEINLREYSQFQFVPQNNVYLFTVTVTRVENGISRTNNEIPTKYSIDTVYPNPFNSTLNVVVGLPEKSDLQVSVFNLLGQRVAILADEQNVNGYRNYVFKAHGLSSGIYFINAQVPGKFNALQKVILVQ